MADALIKRLEAVAERLEKSTSKLGAAGGDEEKSRATEDYDIVYSTAIQPFIDTCNQLGAVSKIVCRTIPMTSSHDDSCLIYADWPQGTATETSFKALRKIIQAAGACKKPSDADLMEAAGPIVKVVGDAQNVDNRSSIVNHEKAFAEFIQLMNWLFQSSPGMINNSCMLCAHPVGARCVASALLIVL